MSIKTKTYDPACYALAEHFLQDESLDDLELHEMLCRGLAQQIQDAIENWLFVHLMTDQTV